MTTDVLNAAEAARAIAARRPVPVCESCLRRLAGAELGDGITVFAECCGRAGLCVECREPGEHACR